jgi:hypothetical protein
MRKETLPKSMTIRSTKVAVIISTPCLNCDSMIRTTSIASDNAADVSGRRNSRSQQQLRSPQVRTNAACAEGSDSNAISRPSAAACRASSSASRPAWPRSAAAAAMRCLSDNRAGGMTRVPARVPAMRFGADAEPCHHSAIRLS